MQGLFGIGQHERATATSSAGGIKTALSLDKEKPPRRIECGFAKHVLGTGRFLFEIFTLPLTISEASRSFRMRGARRAENPHDTDG